LGADYALMTTSSYVNVEAGVKDSQVFDVPAQCHRASRPKMMSGHEVSPEAEAEFYN